MTSSPETLQTCRSCQSAFSGSFCSKCGEKVLEPSEKSIRSFFSSLFHEMTTLDGKFLRTLVLMLRKPGEVSYHYMNGRRVPFYKPVSMFFVANLLYFLFPPVTALNSGLYIQMNMLPHSKWATAIVNKYLATHQLSLETFTMQFDMQATTMSKIFLVLLIAYFSIPLTLVNFNRRMYFSDHLLVSLEACSLIILVAFFTIPWLIRFFVAVGGWAGFHWEFLLTDLYGSIVSMLALLYFFYQLERKAYSQQEWKALGKAAFLIFCFFVVLQTYRATLFFITMWSV